MDRLAKMKDNIYTSVLIEVIQSDDNVSNNNNSFVFMVMPYKPSNLKRLID